MSVRNEWRLAIDGGRPALSRPVNHYHGAAFLGDEEKAAVLEVLESRSLYRYYGPNLLGKVAAFESAFSSYIGTQFALACSSGTAALRLCLIGAGIGPGDEVILPAATFIASAGAVVAQGAVPVFAEVDRLLTLDPEDVESKITTRTRAIMPVHLYGVSCDMGRLTALARRHDLRIIEDVAQACGVPAGPRKLGSLGHLGAFSFQLEKHITAGEGGAVVTDDEELWAKAASYHDQGGSVRIRAGDERAGAQRKPMMGENLRMGEISGAILGCQLSKLDHILARSKQALVQVREACGDVQADWLADDPVRAEYATVVALLAPDPVVARKVVRALRSEGLLSTQVYGGQPVYLSEQLRNRRLYVDRCAFSCPRLGHAPAYRPGLCPRSEDLLARSVAVLLGPAYSEEDCSGISFGLRKVARAYL